jgi:hypothetical protein
MTGGRCRGISIIKNHWDTYEGCHPLCVNCISRNRGDGICPVLEGIENVGTCEAWQEFAIRNEIKISNKKCKF